MGQELCQILKFRFCQNLDEKFVRQNQNFASQNHDFDLEFGVSDLGIHFQNLNPKSVSPIPLESCSETQKFEISDVENP